MKKVNYRKQAKRELCRWFRREILPSLKKLPTGSVIQVGDGLPVILVTKKP